VYSIASLNSISSPLGIVIFSGPAAGAAAQKMIPDARAPLPCGNII